MYLSGSLRVGGEYREGSRESMMLGILHYENRELGRERGIFFL